MKTLSKPVLVLNKTWSVISVITLEKAISLLFKTYRNGEPRARVVDTESFSAFTWNDWGKMQPKEGESILRGVGKNFRIPEVILLTRYDKVPFREPKFNRRSIYRRDNNVCQYCGKDFPTSELNLDHVVPRCRGGQTTWENVVQACIKCNSRKGDRRPEEVGMKLIKKPVKPKLDIVNYDRRYCPESWKSFISECYWNVELENDN